MYREDASKRAHTALPAYEVEVFLCSTHAMAIKYLREPHVKTGSMMQQGKRIPSKRN